MKVTAQVVMKVLGLCLLLGTVQPGIATAEGRTEPLPVDVLTETYMGQTFQVITAAPHALAVYTTRSFADATVTQAKSDSQGTWTESASYEVTGWVKKPTESVWTQTPVLQPGKPYFDSMGEKKPVAVIFTDNPDSSARDFKLSWRKVYESSRTGISYSDWTTVERSPAINKPLTPSESPFGDSQLDSRILNGALRGEWALNSLAEERPSFFRCVLLEVWSEDINQSLPLLSVDVPPDATHCDFKLSDIVAKRPEFATTPPLGFLITAQALTSTNQWLQGFEPYFPSKSAPMQASNIRIADNKLTWDIVNDWVAGAASTVKIYWNGVYDDSAKWREVKPSSLDLAARPQSARLPLGDGIYRFKIVASNANGANEEISDWMCNTTCGAPLPYANVFERTAALTGALHITTGAPKQLEVLGFDLLACPTKTKITAESCIANGASVQFRPGVKDPVIVKNLLDRQKKPISSTFFFRNVYSFGHSDWVQGDTTRSITSAYIYKPNIRSLPGRVLFDMNSCEMGFSQQVEAFVNGKSAGKKIAPFCKSTVFSLKAPSSGSVTFKVKICGLINCAEKTFKSASYPVAASKPSQIQVEWPANNDSTLRININIRDQYDQAYKGPVPAVLEWRLSRAHNWVKSDVLTIRGGFGVLIDALPANGFYRVRIAGKTYSRNYL